MRVVEALDTRGMGENLAGTAGVVKCPDTDPAPCPLAGGWRLDSF